MQREKVNKRIISFSLTLIMILSIFSLNFAVNADTKEDYQKKIVELEKQQQELNQKLTETRNEQTKLNEYQGYIDQNIRKTEEQLDLILLQIDRYTDEIDSLEKDMEKKQGEIDEGIETLKKRIRSMYVTGDYAKLSILLEAKDFGDFLSRVKIIESISKHDNNLIDKIRDDKQLLKENQELLVEKKAIADSNRAQVTEKQNNLRLLYEENRQILIKLSNIESETAGNLQQIEGDLTHYEDEIVRIIQEERDRANYDGGDDDVGIGPPRPGIPGYPGKTVFDGTFLWPVPHTKNITSGFGARWGRTHKGIDIAGGGDYGRNIVASAPGTVIYANNNTDGSGYGKYIIIEHSTYNGHTYQTLYAHGSALLVGYGTKVKSGDIIARIGSTGNSTGPHLHFEVRVDGSARNPSSYVS